MSDENETPEGTGSETETGTAANGSLLERIMTEGKLARDESQRDYARDLISEFVDSVLAEGGSVSSDVVRLITDKIAEIDAFMAEARPRLAAE